MRFMGDNDTGVIPKSTVSLSSDPIHAAVCTRLSAFGPEPLHGPVDQAVRIRVSSGCRRGARQVRPLISSGRSANSVIGANTDSRYGKIISPENKLLFFPDMRLGQSKHYLHVERFAFEIVIDCSWHCECCAGRILPGKELCPYRPIATPKSSGRRLVFRASL
jgi:hypothetical protein